MLSDALKEGTRDLHLATEKILVQYLKENTTVEGYSRLLKAFYGFMMPLEQKIGQYIDPERLPDYPQRRRAAALIDDLEALGMTGIGESIAQCAEVDYIDSYASAMGALYVCEGSSLGGSVIVDMIKKRVNIKGEPFAFFSSYGSRTMGMWHDFLVALNAYPDQAEASVTLKSAGQTFAVFGKWLESQLTYADIEK